MPPRNFFRAEQSRDALSKHAASGQRSIDNDPGGELSEDAVISKADPLSESKSTGVFDSIKGFFGGAPKQEPSADYADEINGVGGKTGVGDADTKPTLSPNQTLGLAGASAGFAYMEGITELKSEEADALHDINQNYANFEFAHKLNKSARMLSETRSMLNAIKNIERQAIPDSSGTQTQQFTHTGSTAARGVLL